MPGETHVRVQSGEWGESEFTSEAPGKRKEMRESRQTVGKSHAGKAKMKD